MNDPEIDRILAMTDDEVLAEARADGIDPEQNAIELRAPFDRVAAFTDRPFEMMTDINGKPIPRWQERLEQMYTDGVPFGEILGYVRWLLRQRCMTLSDLYRAYHRELWGFCANQLGPDAADDASGDLWLRAVRAWPRYQEQHQGRAWLYAIARNVCVDTLRRESRTLPLDALGDILSAHDTLSDVDSIIDARSLLAPLPGRQARALWLTACEYRQTEAAAVLGVSVLGLKALLHRGRANI